MIWFWVTAGSLVLIALIALLRPLLRAAAGGGDHRESALAAFRDQLANIDAEIAQGRLSGVDAEARRIEITRRMLAAAEQGDRGASSGMSGSSETSSRIAAAVAIAALLPTAALAIYAAVGMPAAIGRAGSEGASAAAAPHDRTELAAAAEQLKTRLEQQPGHLEGWVLLGRTFTSLGRFAEARDAYNHAIALAPNEPQLHAELGELLVLAAGGRVTSDAQAEFANSGNDPRARFYGAEAAMQRGDRDAAKSALRALLADAPADAPWRKAVEDRFAEIAPGEQPPAAAAPQAPSAGPTARDVAAAQAMSPEERQKMIRGMVDRLAARLEQNPNDKEGWARLAHAYDVLGETEKAEAARARAAQIPSSQN